MEEFMDPFQNYCITIGIIFLVFDMIIFNIWFPKKYGRSGNKKEKLRIKGCFWREIKNAIKEKHRIWMFTLADDHIVRTAQKWSLVIAVFALATGVFCLYHLHMFFVSKPLPYSKLVLAIGMILCLCEFICVVYRDRVEYIKKKKKKLISHIYKWKPYGQSGVSRRLADRFPANWKNFEEFHLHIERNIGYGYHFYEEYKINSREAVYTYLCEYQEKCKLDILQIIHVSKITTDKITWLNLYFQKIITDYFGRENIEVPITLTFILCVEKSTDLFRRIIDTQIQQIEERSVLPIGISFDNGNVCFTRTDGTEDFVVGFLRAIMLEVLYGEKG